MIDSIQFELQQLSSANLNHLIPAYLLEFFKDELNDRILVSLISDLDSLIQTIEANNSFKILSINDHVINNANLVSNATNNDISISSSLSDTVLTSCKSLLADISNRLNEIFSKYSHELGQIIYLFEKQHQEQKRLNLRVQFSSRNELIVYQRAILVQKLQTKHYALFNLVFRNVFDYYQKQTSGPECSPDETITSDLEQDERMNESQTNSLNLKSRSNNEILLENFDRINQILYNFKNLVFFFSILNSLLIFKI